jgi:hypothetical protein
MKSIRKYTYAVVLTLSALNFAPNLASAQDEVGSFTLPHEVLWQNAEVPAGDYRFTLQAMGPTEMLTLTKISGAPASFMLMVNDTETARLVIHSKSGSSYVSSMTLPLFEITLHFAAPKNYDKEIAQAHTSATNISAQ